MNLLFGYFNFYFLRNLWTWTWHLFFINLVSNQVDNIIFGLLTIHVIFNRILDFFYATLPKIIKDLICIVLIFKIVNEFVIKSCLIQFYFKFSQLQINVITAILKSVLSSFFCYQHFFFILINFIANLLFQLLI